jgi:hypothetical protein
MAARTYDKARWSEDDDRLLRNMSEAGKSLTLMIVKLKRPLVSIENAAAVPRVLCELVPLSGKAQASLPIIFADGFRSQIAAFISVALKSVGLGHGVTSAR